MGVTHTHTHTHAKTGIYDRVCFLSGKEGGCFAHVRLQSDTNTTPKVELRMRHCEYEQKERERKKQRKKGINESDEEIL